MKAPTAEQAAKPGRKPLAAGEGKTARLSLRTTLARKAMIESAAQKAGLSENAWLERAADALAGVRPAKTP